MKILELRFKNLNSLYGEWAVDFTHPRFEADGIFAITGPTGAGKSTVLDALCLALYARTPRLNAVTKGGNESMSRRTGECYSEVVFETARGRFCCNWSQRRAYKKSDGNLGDSRHEISDALTGKVLETKKREVANRIEAETGMDFDRFTRSMLLAQGGFSAFLAASPDDRSPILEQITGTGIYSEISMAVHHRLKAEKQIREEMKSRTAGIPILNEEEKETLEADLKAKEGDRKDRVQVVRDQEKDLAWKKGILDLETEMAELDSRGKTLARDQEAFKGQEEALAWAQKARELESDYQILSAGRDKREQDARILKEERNRLPQLERNLATRNQASDQAKKALDQWMESCKQGLAQIKVVRELDLKLGEKQTAVTTAREEVGKWKTALSKREGELVQARKQEEELKAVLKEIQNFLETQGRDQGLATALAGIEARVAELAKIKEQRQAMQGEWKQFNQSLKAADLAAEKAEAHCGGLEKEEDRIIARIEALEKKLAHCLDGKLLREYRAEKEALLREQGHIKKIISLEAEREKLKAGEACPLCGALDHPFALSELPRLDETEARLSQLGRIIQEAETLEHEIRGLELKGKHQAQERMNAENQAARARSDKELARQRMDQCEAKGREVKAQMDRLGRDLDTVLEPFGEKLRTAADLAGICANLVRRRDAWAAKDKERDSRSRELEGIQTEIRHLTRATKEQVEGLQERRHALERLEKEANALSMERRQAFGDKDPDAEEARFQATTDQAREALEKSREAQAGAKEEKDGCDQRINTLIQTSAQELKRVGDLSQAFDGKLGEIGFQDEADFLRRRMAKERLSALENQARELVDRKKELEARRADRKEKLETARREKRTNLALEKLEARVAQSREKMEKLGEEIGALNQRLTDNAAAEKKLAAVVEEIQKQDRECRRWEALHGLIGSADGKKYRNFAQGLTFEQVVNQANQQLVRMTDRYLLVRDQDEPLALNIMDQYQAGEIRSTRNLSGGESFIVSLSLALGLSRMAGAKVRVDSLFLDEGFGTLDEEALEVALDALAGLHREGKSIGVISHIPALKERIGTQIVIEPRSGGKSMISGPGVTRL